MVKRLVSWLKPRPRLDECPPPDEDPTVHSSMAGAIAFWSLLLAITLLWAFYQEGWGLRPWRDYQKRFANQYRHVLEDLGPKRVQEMKAVQASEEYKGFLKRIQQAEEEARPQVMEVEAGESLVRKQLDAITKLFTTERSRVQASIYQFETADMDEKPELKQELKELRARTYEVMFPGAGEVPSRETFSYQELEELFASLKANQGNLQSRKVELLQEEMVLRRELNRYLKPRLPGLSEAQVAGLLAKVDRFDPKIFQIHNPEMNLVDRCESCHAGIGEPVELTLDKMEGERVFTSHPARRLLDIHDPEVFGCSPCHNGNGVGTVSVKRAHGLYKHWLWPLYPRENFEAGCLQCHEADRELEIAPVLNAGKEIYAHLGCWGCHPREGFETEPRELRNTYKLIRDLDARHEETQIRIEQAIIQGDRAETNEEAGQFYAEVKRLTLDIANLDTELERSKVRVNELFMEAKKPAPNLKEVRVKLQREWIPEWIKDPHAFRPTTRMPGFRLEEDQLRTIAAFIWQSGIEAQLPKRSPGDLQRGKELFETRGCMACHSIGEGDKALGGSFAANLSRVGEKTNYEYLVRWIHNPRERTLPYCPDHKRDITPEDYADEGLPFEFSLKRNDCPLGDHKLQVQNATIMPNLRLSWEAAQDIASYLMDQRSADVQYAPASYLDDPELRREGRFWVRHFGCAGCHEISGLEEEGKIGTELTKEGSKPIERLDFALLTHEAKKEGWYNHKGFFERKLTDPAVYDLGKEQTKDVLERLRMPNFQLNKEGIDKLTTFLLGSVESKVPEKFFHRPRDQRRDIQAGWWLVKKYNCVACHQFTATQQTVLKDLPLYQSEDWREQLPPSLIGEGARVNPNWLARFLKNPALTETSPERNGVRPYLEARMPTFNLSDTEVQKLVRFFQALSKQQLPYLPPEPEPLTSREINMARRLFTHPAAPCLRCHAVGDPVRDRDATAPSFVLGPERLQAAWTERWIVHPEIIQPGTNMPSGLFRWDGTRWVFALAQLEEFQDYPNDHANLLVRYMLQFTPEEQRRLSKP